MTPFIFLKIVYAGFTFIGVSEFESIDGIAVYKFWYFYLLELNSC